MRRCIVLIAVLATACGGGGNGGPSSPTPQPFNQTLTGTVSVFGTTFHPISTPRAGNMRLTLSWSGSVDLDLYLTNPNCELANLASSQLLAAADGFVNPETISRTVSANESLALLTWPTETFAYADSFDESAERYRGLRGGQLVSVSAESSGLLVRPTLAQAQIDADSAKVPPSGSATTGQGPGGLGPAGPVTGPGSEKPQGPKPPTRFHGTVNLDPSRVGRDSSRIAEEVIAHLVGLVGSTVTVTLEIEADIPAGAPDNVVRTVTENSRTLRFTQQGFERD